MAAFDVILLDQGKTFMFENDRFGPDVDYAATYRQLGGHALSDTALHAVVVQLHSHLLAAYRDAARDAAFPTIAQAIETLNLGLADDERERIDDLFAHHEVGTIAPRHVTALHDFARTHRLGIVSNIWAAPKRFVSNLIEAGVHDCFEHLIWSSTHGCLKPTPRLFEHALRSFAVSPERVLFVGDDPLRDIDAAASLGMSTAWLRHGEYPDRLRAPDLIVDDLAELPALLD